MLTSVILGAACLTHSISASDARISVDAGLYSMSEFAAKLSSSGVHYAPSLELKRRAFLLCLDNVPVKNVFQAMQDVYGITVRKTGDPNKSELIIDRDIRNRNNILKTSLANSLNARQKDFLLKLKASPFSNRSTEELSQMIAADSATINTISSKVDKKIPDVKSLDQMNDIFGSIWHKIQIQTQNELKPEYANLGSFALSHSLFSLEKVGVEIFGSGAINNVVAARSIDSSVKLSDGRHVSDKFQAAVSNWTFVRESNRIDFVPRVFFLSESGDFADFNLTGALPIYDRDIQFGAKTFAELVYVGIPGSRSWPALLGKKGIERFAEQKIASEHLTLSQDSKDLIAHLKGPGDGLLSERIYSYVKEHKANVIVPLSLNGEKSDSLQLDSPVPKFPSWRPKQVDDILSFENLLDFVDEDDDRPLADIVTVVIRATEKEKLTGASFPFPILKSFYENTQPTQYDGNTSYFGVYLHELLMGRGIYVLLKDKWPQLMTDIKSQLYGTKYLSISKLPESSLAEMIACIKKGNPSNPMIFAQDLTQMIHQGTVRVQWRTEGNGDISVNVAILDNKPGPAYARLLPTMLFSILGRDK